MRKRGSKQIVATLLMVGLKLGVASGASSGVDFSQGYTFKTVALGLGGAYRAFCEGSSGMLLNPAGMAIRKGEISFSGDYIHSGFTNGNTWGMSAVDFKASDSVAMGFEYDGSNFSPGNDVNVHQITLGAATDFGHVIYVGANLKGYFSTVDSPSITGPDGVDMDLGLTVRPVPYISLALTTHNIFLGYNTPEFPFLLGFAAALNLEGMAKVAVDIVRDFGTPSSSGKLNTYFGGELRLTEGLFARGGFGLDQVRDNNFYSIGASVSGPKINLNFTFLQHLNPSDSTYALGLEFRV